MLLYISGTTILLSILLAVYNWRVNRNSLFLSLCFIVISIYSIAHHFTVYGKDPFWLAIFYNHFAPLSFLAGPFLFFYVRGTLTDRYLINKTDLIHFVPFLVHLIGIIPYLIMPFSEKMEIVNYILLDLDNLKHIKTNVIFSLSASFIIRPVMLAGYVTYCIYLLFAFSPFDNKHSRIPRHQFLMTYRWLIILLTSLFLLSISFLIVSFQFLATNADMTLSQSGRLYYLTGGVLGFMALMLLFFPRVLYGLPNYQENNQLDISNPVHSPTESVGTVFNNLEKLDQAEEPFVELGERLKKYLVEKKPFLHPDFRIEDLAKVLQVPLNHVTYCLNSVLNTKFTTLRMELRIDYAKQLLKEGKTDELTIEAIAQKSGFSTRSSFYNAFKAVTGITPTEYLKNNE